MGASGDRAVAGVATVSFLAAVAVSLIAFVAVCNLLVFAYARGAARVALDEGARAGARAADPAECARRAEAALDDLLGGALRAAFDDVACALEADVGLHATVEGHLPAWAPGVPDWPAAERASAAIRAAPP